MTTDVIPRPALLLGWAGVIPFALLTTASVLDIHPWSLDPAMALRAYDLSTVRRGLAPRWYASLRVQLTLAVVVLLGIAVLA
jgi:hypothetical protein